MPVTKAAQNYSTAAENPSVIERLARRDHAVYLLLAAYFAANFLLRVMLAGSLEADEGQQLFLTQWLSAGYDHQPPFYTWIQYGVVQLFGANIVSLALLKNLMLFGSYLLYGLAASLVIRDRVLAVIATLALITIPQISVEMQRDLTHTVGALFAACMLLYFLLRTLQRPTALNYALVGAAIGMGTIAKYNFVLLPAAVFVAVLSMEKFRPRLLDWRIILTALCAALIVTPNALWLIDHFEFVRQATTNRLVDDPSDGRLVAIGKGLASLVRVIASTILLPLAAFWIAFGKRFTDAWATQNDWTILLGRTMLVIAALMVCLVLAGTSQFRGRWAAPYFMLFPIYLGLKIDAMSDAAVNWRQAARRFSVIVVACMVLMPAVLYGRVLVGPLFGSYKKQNVPYGPAVEEILAANPDRPAMVLAMDQQMAGNVRRSAPDLRVMVPGYEWLAASETIDNTRPVLVVWRGNPTAAVARAADWVKVHPGYARSPVEARDLNVPYHYGNEDDTSVFGYAWIYPIQD